MDIAMASYQSELDYLTNAMTNHVLSAELHNQAVNSLAFISARYTQQALDILQMMITNIFCAQLQAIDLRHMKNRTEDFLEALFEKHSVAMCEPVRKAFPWYQFVFAPQRTLAQLFAIVTVEEKDQQEISNAVVKETSSMMESFKAGLHIPEVERLLGEGRHLVFHSLCLIYDNFKTNPIQLIDTLVVAECMTLCAYILIINNSEKALIKNIVKIKCYNALKNIMIISLIM